MITVEAYCAANLSDDEDNNNSPCLPRMSHSYYWHRIPVIYLVPGTWYLVPGSIRYQAVVTIIVLLLFSHQSLAPYSEMVIRQGLTSEVEEY